MNKNIIIKTFSNNILLFNVTTTALLEDNFLSYYTDNDKININLENFSFTKYNNESIFKLTNDLCTVTVRELNKTFEIPINYVNFVYNNDEINLEYLIDSQEYPLKLQIIIGSDINEL